VIEMSEPLPFQEYIELEGWRHRNIDIESYRDAPNPHENLGSSGEN
jgi:hypothetical protein